MAFPKKSPLFTDDSCLPSRYSYLSIDNLFLTSRSFRWLSIAAAALLLLSAPGPALAATDTWTDNNGAGNANWATATNWADPTNVAPVAHDSLDFTGTNGLVNNNNFSTGMPVDGITFDSAAGAFTLNGNGILISGKTHTATDLITPGIVNSSINNQTINLPVTLDWGSYLIGNTAAGALALNGTLSANTGGAVVFDENGGGAITSSTMAIDSTGLIAGLDGVGLIENTTSNELAALPLATLSGTNIVALPSTAYAMATGEISAVATSNSNVLLNPSSTGVTFTANDTGNNGVTLVNTITEEAGVNTISITGTLVLGAGASNSVGGIYETEPTGAANGILVVSGSTVGASAPTGWLTSGTTSAGGTVVFGINSTPANASNEINENTPIINNAAGGPVTVVKVGNGSMNFHLVGAGDANYSGGTYVDQGFLQANATGVLGVGPIYVAGGATLYLETTQSNNLFLSRPRR